MSSTVARLLAAGCLWFASTAAAPALDGVFFGLEDASGATLRLSPPAADGSQKGQYIDERGDSAVFVGTSYPDGMEATFPIGGGELYLRAIEHPSGAIVVAIPVDQGGALRADLTRSAGFVREGGKAEKRRPYQIPEPAKTGAPVDAVSFIQSFEFWSPDGVGRGYVGVLPRYRSVMALFPALQTDIIAKLCAQTSPAAPGLAEALRGQGVSCDEVRAALDRARRSGRYAAYKRDVAADRQIAFEAVSCARRIGTRERCEEVARLTSEAAISMVNAATVVARYR